MVDIAFGRTPDLKMLDGWGRKRDLPDKSAGSEMWDDLPKKREAEGKLVNGVDASQSHPAWLATGNPPRQPHSRVVLFAVSPQITYAEVEERRREAFSPEEREEDSRLQWLAYYEEEEDWDHVCQRPIPF